MRKFKHTGYKPRCCGKQMQNLGYSRGCWEWKCKKCGGIKLQCD